jgi:hypothetical protein
MVNHCGFPVGPVGTENINTKSEVHSIIDLYVQLSEIRIRFMEDLLGRMKFGFGTVIQRTKSTQWVMI